MASTVGAEDAAYHQITSANRITNTDYAFTSALDTSASAYFATYDSTTGKCTSSGTAVNGNYENLLAAGDSEYIIMPGAYVNGAKTYDICFKVTANVDYKTGVTSSSATNRKWRFSTSSNGYITLACGYYTGSPRMDHDMDVWLQDTDGIVTDEDFVFGTCYLNSRNESVRLFGTEDTIYTTNSYPSLMFKASSIKRSSVSATDVLWSFNSEFQNKYTLSLFGNGSLNGVVKVGYRSVNNSANPEWVIGHLTEKEPVAPTVVPATGYHEIKNSTTTVDDDFEYTSAYNTSSVAYFCDYDKNTGALTQTDEEVNNHTGRRLNSGEQAYIIVPDGYLYKGNYYDLYLRVTNNGNAITSTGTSDNWQFYTEGKGFHLSCGNFGNFDSRGCKQDFDIKIWAQDGTEVLKGIDFIAGAFYVDTFRESVRLWGNQDLIYTNAKNPLMQDETITWSTTNAADNKENVYLLGNGTAEDGSVNMGYLSTDAGTGPEWTVGYLTHYHCACGELHCTNGTHATEGKILYKIWDDPTSLPTDGDYFLNTDVTLTDTATIAAGNTLNICLNGHVIQGNGTDPVLVNNGAVTITDHKSEVKRYYTYNEDGAWTYIAEPTQEQMDGAVAYENLSTATLTSGNTVVAVTGGVVMDGTIENNGTLEILNGTFIGTADDDGAIYNVGTLTMNGGTVIGNEVGVYCEDAVSTTIGGNTVIQDNATANLYLDGATTPDTFAISTFGTDASVGITSSASEAQITTNGVTTDADYLTADEEGYVVQYNTKGNYFQLHYPILTTQIDIDTDSGITADNALFQAFVNADKGELTEDVNYTFSVTEETPAAAAKTAFDSVAGIRAASYYDATLTKNGTPITDTGDNILSFTVPYSMLRKENLGIYRYNGTTTEPLTQVATTADPADGTYYVNGTDENATITFFTTKLAPFAIASVDLPEAMVGAKYYSILTLNDDLDCLVSIKRAKAFTDAEVAKFSVTVDGVPAQVVNENGNAVFLLSSRGPACMGEAPTAIVSYDGTPVKEFSYSVRRYCETVINNASYPEIAKTVCTTALNYGAWAQLAFGIHTDDLVNANITDTTESVIIDENDIPAYTKNLIGGITKISTATKLDTMATLYFYFAAEEGTMNLDELLVKNNYEEQVVPECLSLTYDTANSRYVLAITDRGADKIHRSYTVMVKETEDVIVTYSIYNALNTYATGDYSEELQIFARAMYAYSEAAREYLAYTYKA